jgi:integral membrane protein (TIGR01906 family)
VLAIGLFILAIPVALTTTNVRFLVSQQSVYDYSVRTYDASSVSGIPEDELLRANERIGQYLTSSDAGPLAIRVRNNGGDLVPLFNSREIAHMADVRGLVQALLIVQVAAIAVLVALAIVMLVLWPPRALAAAALYGSLLTGAVLGMAAVLALTGFDSAWSQFHVFAFSNDLWQLDPNSDHLIQMFPEAFWQEITTLLGVVTLLEALLVAGPAAAYLVRSRPKEEVRAIAPSPEVAGPEGHARPRLERPKPRHFTR